MYRHASKYMIANGVSAILGFAAIAIFTRLLSPTEYGVYVIGMSLMGIVNAMLFSWVRLSVLRFQSESGVDVRRSAIVGYGISLLLTPVAVLLALVLSDMPLMVVILAVFVALALGLFDFGQEVFRAQQLPDAYMRVAILRAGATLGVSLVMVHLGLGGSSLLIGLGTAYLIAGIVASPWVWRPPVREFDRTVFRQIAAFGVPMALSGALFALHAALDRFLVAHFLGETSAGIYGASADLVRQIILFPAVSIGSAAGPLVIRAFTEGGREGAQAQLQSSVGLLFSVLLPATVGLAIVAPSFAFVMLGPEFRTMAQQLIPVLVLAWLFQALTHQYLHLSFHLAKATRLVLLQGGILLVINVAAMMVLVPPFGLIGAAWALVVAEVLGLVIGLVLTRWAFEMPPLPASVAKVFLATLIMAVPAFFVAMLTAGSPVLSLVATTACGILIYGGAALALNLLGVRDQLFKPRSVELPAK